MTIEAVAASANLVSVADPKYLSLVGRPANKISFRVVRSAEGATTTGEPNMKPPVVRRQRRSEPSPILQVSFPAGYTDEQVKEQMTAFGLTGYDVVQGESGVTAVRSDLQSISPGSTVEVKLTSDGVFATISRSDVSVAANPKSALTMASVSVAAEAVSQETLQRWAETLKVPADTFVDHATVVRCDVPEGEETRTIELEPGVSAVVFRSDSTDIPDGYVAVVNETCYGNWGWGQLDFAAAMADTEFCEAMDEATYRLRRVLDDILLYSALPLAERKTLMVNALKQYEAFAVGILDSLPRTVLVAVARSANPRLETQTMSNNANPGGAGQPTTQPAATTAAAPEYVTRSDFDAFTSRIETLLGASKADPAPTATRADGGEGGDKQPAAAAVTRSDLEELLKPLTGRLDAMEGRTVVRSDLNADQNVTATTTTTTTTAPKDVFRGSPVFGGLGIPNRPKK